MSTSGRGDHRIVPYDEGWRWRAQHLIGRLRVALGPIAVRIDHIGSTSVVGMAARPIIDVQISVADVTDRELFERPLRELGYEHFPFPELPIEDYLVYVNRFNTEHIAVCENGSWQERRHLALCEYLRTHPDAARRYESVKRRSASGAAGVRQLYAAGKNDTVQALERAAVTWFARMQPDPGSGAP